MLVIIDSQSIASIEIVQYKPSLFCNCKLWTIALRESNETLQRNIHNAAATPSTRSVKVGADAVFDTV